MRVAMDLRMMRRLFPLVTRPTLPFRTPQTDVFNRTPTGPVFNNQIGARGFQFFSSAAKNDAPVKPEQSVDRNADQEKPESLEETEVEKTLRQELNKTVSENSNLLLKTKELEDKYMRALAETENLRTRLTKQINDAKIYAVQGFCKDMAEISDILRMAIDSVPKDQLTDSNPHLKNLYDGLSMTDSRLMQVFKSHGLTQINPLDGQFNPNEHEAVVHQPVEGKASGTVIFVSKVGYKLHERVIRPAVVGVAK